MFFCTFCFQNQPSAWTQGWSFSVGGNGDNDRRSKIKIALRANADHQLSQQLALAISASNVDTDYVTDGWGGGGGGGLVKLPRMVVVVSITSGGVSSEQRLDRGRFTSSPNRRPRHCWLIAFYRTSDGYHILFRGARNRNRRKPRLTQHRPGLTII